MAAHMDGSAAVHARLDPRPINSGFAAVTGPLRRGRRRHPEAEMLMGIGNLTELTEADSAGVTRC